MHYFRPAEEISVRAKPSPPQGLGEIRAISGEPKSFFSYLLRSIMSHEEWRIWGVWGASTHNPHRDYSKLDKLTKLYILTIILFIVQLFLCDKNIHNFHLKKGIQYTNYYKLDTQKEK